MARKEITITLEDDGTPLTFRIRQMPATKMESWLMRTVLLLAGSSADLPEGTDMHKAGQYLAAKGITALGGLDYDKAKPLLDDLLHCCHRMLDGAEQPVTESTVDGYITDVRNLFKLRMEALRLNLDFFGSGVLSAFQSTATGEGTPSS